MATLSCKNEIKADNIEAIAVLDNIEHGLNNGKEWFINSETYVGVRIMNFIVWLYKKRK